MHFDRRQYNIMASNNVYKRYNKVLEDLNLDGYPIEDYDELDNISLIASLGKSFGIYIDDEMAEHLLDLKTHMDRINFLETLL